MSRTRRKRRRDEKQQDTKKIERPSKLEKFAFNITDFPHETLVIMMRFLSIKDLANTDLVCHLFLAIGRSNDVWKPLFFQHHTLSNQAINQYRQSFLLEQLRKEVQPSQSECAFRENKLFSCIISNDEPEDLLKEIDPDYSSIRDIFPMFSLGGRLFVLRCFSQSSTRLWRNPYYQPRLDKVYDLISAELKSEALPPSTQQDASTVTEVPCVLSHPIMRTVLFNGSYEKLRTWQQQGFDVNQTFDNEWVSPLHLAVRLSNLRQVTYLSELGANLNVTVTRQRYNHHASLPRKNTTFTSSLAGLAAGNKQNDIFIYFLEKLKGQLDIEEMIKTAYLANDVVALNCFLECSIEIAFQILMKSFDYSYWVELIEASVERNCISLIKKNQEMLDHKESDFKKKLLIKAAFYLRFEMFAYLLETFKDQVNIAETCEECYRQQDATALAYFLNCGIEIDFKTLKSKHKLPLWEALISMAVKNNHLVLVRKLLAVTAAGINKNAPANSRAAGRLYWLHTAAKFGYSEMVTLLLHKGAYVDRKNAAGRTALYIAISCNHLNVVRVLIKENANIEQVFQNMHDYSNTPLRLALYNGYATEIAEYLFEIFEKKSQALPLEQKVLKQLLNYAIHAKHTAVVALLLSKVQDVNYNKLLFDASGITAQLETVKLLAEKYADIHFHLNQRLCMNMSALTNAIQWGKETIARYLLSKGVCVREEDWIWAYIHSQKLLHYPEPDAYRMLRLLNQHTQQFPTLEAATEASASLHQAYNEDCMRGTLFHNRVALQAPKPSPGPNFST